MAKGPAGGWSLGLYSSLIFRPMLFNIFNNELDTGAEFTLSKFSDDTKLGGLAARLGGCSTVQRDLNRLESLAEGNLVKFHNRKPHEPGDE